MCRIDGLPLLFGGFMGRRAVDCRMDHWPTHKYHEKVLQKKPANPVNRICGTEARCIRP